MNVTAKHIKLSNIVCMFKDGDIRLPEPVDFFACYTSDENKGAMFSDNVSASARIFELPTRGVQWVFEPSRIRLEDKKFRTPAESKLAHEFLRVQSRLYPSALSISYGFNYDILYQMDGVIPVGDIMRRFLKPETVEKVRDFGWQYSLSHDKGRRIETYFFKVVSPIEYAVHANHHFNQPVIKETGLQSAFERSYVGMDGALLHIASNHN